jgi:UDP-GlcNAc:undecaprenyl-phosphate GlcNAc-1-phosphate transferase
MEQLLYFPILIVGFVGALTLTPLSRALALRLGVVAIPSQRNIHKDYKPMMGGTAIVFGLAIALLLFCPPALLPELLVYLGGAAFLWLVGLLDDRFNLGIRIRLVAQAVVGVWLIAGGVDIALLGFAPVDYLLTVVWVVALCNSLNFLDNMDGLSATITAIAGVAFTVLGVRENLTLVSMIGAGLAGSAVGFFIHNFNPASTFMGDNGSLVLGYTLAVLGIKLRFGEQPPGVTWMVPVFILALPIIDICLVVITRALEHRPIGQGGRDHSSHRLLAMGLSQRATLAVLGAVCATYGLLAYVVATTEPTLALLLGLLGLLGMAALFVALMWMRQRYQYTPPPAP